MRLLNWIEDNRKWIDALLDKHNFKIAVTEDEEYEILLTYPKIDEENLNDYNCVMFNKEHWNEKEVRNEFIDSVECLSRHFPSKIEDIDIKISEYNTLLTSSGKWYLISVYDNIENGVFYANIKDHLSGNQIHEHEFPDGPRLWHRIKKVYLPIVIDLIKE